MDIVLDVAFVIAVVAFLKEQFSLKGSAVIAWAFVVTLIFGFAPLIATMLPPIAPFVDALLKVVVLFLGAAGSWDAVRSIARKQTK